jgi:membrane-associated protein
MISFVDFILHIDYYLDAIVSAYPNLAYLFLFFIIFLETGVVVIPFLPGDSLLFVAGAIAALGSINVFVLFGLLLMAAIIGDAVNYQIGRYVGPRVFRSEKLWLLNKNHLLKAQEFYEKHGKKTIVLARFVPIVRTFAPFVAGIGRMNYKEFAFYNIFGAFLWCFLFIFGGFFFGNIPFVKENFSIFILVIIIVSILPMFLEVVKSAMGRKGTLYNILKV